MTEVEVQIVNRLGLHARAAARFVHVSSRYQAKIMVSKDGTRVDGKSILGLLTLAAPCGVRIRIEAEGEDEKQAIEDLSKLIEDRFGEET